MSTAQLLPNVVQQFRDSNGNVLAGGKLYSYQAGTTTPQATYTDQGAGTPNTNPVVLDSSGAASVWLRTDLTYKLVLKDSSGVTQWTVDNVACVNDGSIDTTKIASSIAGVGLSQNVSSKALDVQVDNSTIETSSNQLRVKDSGITNAKLSGSIDTTKLNSLIEVVFKGQFDTTGYGVHGVPQWPWSAPALQSTPSAFPANSGLSAAWSPNGEFLAVGYATNSPYLLIYQRSGAVFTQLSTPGTTPTGSVYAVAWSPDGQFLACGHTTTPYVTIYQRSGTTFTKLSNPGTLPNADVKDLAFSPNGQFLAIGAGDSTVVVYKISGTTFTYAATTATTNGNCDKVAWSPNSQYLVLGGSGTGSPYLNIYKRFDSTFTKLTDPGTLPTSVTNGFAWSPDGQFLACAVNSSPYVVIYQRSGDTFTKLSNPASLPSSACLSAVWSPNSQYLALAQNNSTSVVIYSVSGTTFTKQADPSSVFGGTQKLDWSPDGRFLACASTTSPYIYFYQTASSIATSGVLWTRMVTNI